MNYLQPRKRQEDGRFDYTCMNDGRIWPIGYCRAHRPFTDKDIDLFGSKEALERANAREAPFANKYHTDGHATEAEAIECYRQYLIDRADYCKMPLNEDDRSKHRKCKVCGKWTQNMAFVDHNSYEFSLCDEHLNRESLVKLMPSPGWSMRS